MLRLVVFIDGNMTSLLDWTSIRASVWPCSGYRGCCCLTGVMSFPRIAALSRRPAQESRDLPGSGGCLGRRIRTAAMEKADCPEWVVQSQSRLLNSGRSNAGKPTFKNDRQIRVIRPLLPAVHSSNKSFTGTRSASLRRLRLRGILHPAPPRPGPRARAPPRAPPRAPSRAPPRAPHAWHTRSNSGCVQRTLRYARSSQHRARG